MTPSEQLLSELDHWSHGYEDEVECKFCGAIFDTHDPTCFVERFRSLTATEVPTLTVLEKIVREEGGPDAFEQKVRADERRRIAVDVNPAPKEGE